MKLDVGKLFSTRSERVKGIDFHPSEPWVLTTLYNGRVEIWLYATNSVVKLIQVTDLPVRTGRFVARKLWIVVGSDDYQLRVYNYNTGERIVQFEAHPDYIRGVAVHPTLPYVLTCSDDLTIKLWNWDNNWLCEQTYEGHQHYIMNVAFNPKDPSTFALACLDRTVKVWLLGSAQPNYTLVAHDVKGVNFVDYYPQSDKPYLISSSDDKTIKVWDYQTKLCVAVLEGHLANVLFAIFHPELPLIVLGSEDGTVRFWNSSTFKLEKLLNYGLERVWCVSVLARLNLAAIGCDLGFVVLKLGSEEPLFSMDPNGKLVYARNLDIYQLVVRNAAKDGEILPLQQRDLGTVEVYPQLLAHLPNGRYVAVCGDGEYLVYTALAWRLRTFGKALDFAWHTHDSSSATPYAVRELRLSVKVFRNFQEHVAVDLAYEAERIVPGALLGVRLSGVVCFYDWDTGRLVRRVDIDDEVTDIVWSDNGALVALLTAGAENETYILSFDRSVFEEALARADDGDADGDDAFDVLYTLPSPEPLLLGKFLGDVFLYTTGTTNRLNYFVGGEVVNLLHFDHKYYIVGYKPAEGRVYLVDKLFNVVSWYVNSAVLELQTLVVRGDLEHLAPLVDADGEQVPDVAALTPADLGPHGACLALLQKLELNQLLRFFEKLGYLQLGFALLQDVESKFAIALATGDLAQAVALLEHDADQAKWKKVGDLALRAWDLVLAKQCFWRARDHASLLLVLSASNERAELQRLAQALEEKGQYNIAFQAWWLTGNVAACVAVLHKTARFPEAAFLGRTYGLPVADTVALWRAQLEKDGSAVAARLELESTLSPEAEGSLSPEAEGSLRPEAESPALEEAVALLSIEPENGTANGALIDLEAA